jgi:hypothetical protein
MYLHLLDWCSGKAPDFVYGSARFESGMEYNCIDECFVV